MLSGIFISKINASQAPRPRIKRLPPAGGGPFCRAAGKKGFP
jgi:hypothetical protein